MPKSRSRSRKATKSKPIAKEPAAPTAAPDTISIDPKTFNPQFAVAARYQEFGWQVMIPAKGGINDIVAQKDKKYHFIQVLTAKNQDEVRYHGEARNMFIQNAFSNSAIPVYAFVAIVKGRTGYRAKITFEDINADTRIIVGGGRTKKDKLVEPNTLTPSA